jgi:hypothetical protein
MAGDTVARSVIKFIYIRVGGQILRIYPPLNKPNTLCTMPRDRDGASNIGTFACRSFPRDTKASKRAKKMTKFITLVQLNI